MYYRAAFKFRAGLTLGFFYQHYAEQVVIRVDRQLHHIALDLIAAPERAARRDINGFQPRFITGVEAEQDQVSSRHRCARVFVQAAVPAPAERLAGLAVDGVKTALRSGKNNAEIGGLVKLNLIVEICLP